MLLTASFSQRAGSSLPTPPVAPSACAHMHTHTQTHSCLYRHTAPPGPHHPSDLTQLLLSLFLYIQSNKRQMYTLSLWLFLAPLVQLGDVLTVYTMCDADLYVETGIFKHLLCDVQSGRTSWKGTVSMSAIATEGREGMSMCVWVEGGLR